MTEKYIDMYAKHIEDLWKEGSEVTAISDTTEDEDKWMVRVRRILKKRKEKK